MGQGGPDVAVSEFVLGRGRQVGSDIDSASHPVGSVLKQAGDTFESDTFFADQGTDHPCFVESGEGTRGRIGQKQQALVLLSATGALEHYRNVAAT